MGTGDGLTPHVTENEELLRGFGVPTVKSLALLSVSCAPCPFLITAVVLLFNAGDDAGAPPSEQLAVEP